jgi:HAD superfamily hydrolase (TIGR01509 family)
MAFPELVIFDCDGVLIDSEGLAHQALIDALAEHGVHMTLEDALGRYTGKSEKEEHADVEARHGVILPVGFSDRKSQMRKKLFEEQLEPVPGVFELLEGLRTKKCIASGSSFERLRHSLGLMDLWDRFAPYIFSAEQVKHGKPAPDLFLSAAEQMSVPASACLVIEDSVAGVQAAKTAGMKVYGFTGGSHCDAVHGGRLTSEGAAAVFNRMDLLAASLGISGKKVCEVFYGS